MTVNRTRFIDKLVALDAHHLPPSSVNAPSYGYSIRSLSKDHGYGYGNTTK